MKRISLFSAAAAPALAVAMASPAFAQDAPQASEPEASAGEIVITAQGRAQQLADVPLAVSAVTSEQLQNSGANDIRQLNQVAPSLLVSSTGSEANGSARIRGIGTVGDNPGLESSVAVFIDGVYRSRSGIGLNELGEIERVEVLRGPQGTLFGRNASAGIISIVSKAPSFSGFSGGAEVTYGNYDLWRLMGNINVPLGETVAAQADRRAELEIGLLPAPLADQIDLEIGAAGRKGITADPPAEIECGQRAAIVGAVVSGIVDHPRSNREIVARPFAVGIVVLRPRGREDDILVDLAVLEIARRFLDARFETRSEACVGGRGDVVGKRRLFGGGGRCEGSKGDKGKRRDRAQWTACAEQHREIGHEYPHPCFFAPSDRGCK